MKPTSKTATAAALAVALVLWGCGAADNQEAAASGGTDRDEVAGAVVVTAPLDADERCHVADEDAELGVELIPGAVGCTGPGRPDNPLAAVGSTFTAESMIVTYRGGGFLRETSDNPANPLRVQALAVFDIQLPGQDTAWFTSSGLREVSMFGRGVSDEGNETGLGECGVFPNASSRLIGAGQGYPANIDEGQTITVAYCGSMAAAEPTLAGDPYVSFQAAIEEGQTYANFALRDQDSDEQAFADVLATIDMLAQADDVDPDELGRAELVSRFQTLTDGAAIVTVDRTSAAPGANDGELDADGQAAEPPLDGEDDGLTPPADGALEADDQEIGPDTAGESDSNTGGARPGSGGANPAAGLTRGPQIDAANVDMAAHHVLEEAGTPIEVSGLSCSSFEHPCVQWVDSEFTDENPDYRVVAFRTQPLDESQLPGTIEGYLLFEIVEGFYHFLERYDFTSGATPPAWMGSDLTEQV